MVLLIILSLKAILSSIIGSSFYQWFKNTKMGVWFQVKMDNTMEWVAERYDLEIATREEKWLSQYPHLADRIVTFGSTIGAEACFLTKPVISLAGAQYDYFDLVYKPISISDLEFYLETKNYL